MPSRESSGTMKPVLKMPYYAISQTKTVDIEYRIEDNIKRDYFTITRQMIAHLPAYRALGMK